MTIGLSCKNPSCKSVGKAHPNCECFGNMADGGEVGHFCSKDRRHDTSCEYFADGGTVESPLHVDPSQSVASFLAHDGLPNLIKMNPDESSEETIDKYNQRVKKGGKNIDQKIDHLFDGKPFEEQDYTKSKKTIHDWVQKGGATNDIQQELYNQNAAPQAFAEGGEVKNESHGIQYNHPIAQAYPEQNMLLQAAKGRMSNYLTGLKPQENVPKLAFDHKPDNRQQKKSYEKALHIAAHPLSVLEHVQKGTIEPEHITHLGNLHPEVGQIMEKKITERIVKDQLENKKPSYKVRQGLSMLLGTPLGSEMTQPNLMAVQASFQTKKDQQQAPKKSITALSKASQPYLTRDDALVARQQRQKS